VTQENSALALILRPASRCPAEVSTYAEALFEAMIHRFYEDPTMVATARKTGLGRVQRLLV
jgi:hypothetical protein